MNAVTETKPRKRLEDTPEVQRDLAEHTLKSAILYAREMLGEEKTRKICEDVTNG